MIQEKIKGVGVALITPFNNYEVDYEALARMIDHVIDGGVDYIVTLGSTAETATLSIDERKQVLRFVIERTAGRVPIVAGMGANDTHALVNHLRTFDLSGTVAILSVVPYYNKLLPNESILIDLTFLKQDKVFGEFSSELTIYYIDDYGNCYYQPLFLKSRTLEGPYRIEYKDYRKNTSMIL